jgi:hypothetical protein
VWKLVQEVGKDKSGAFLNETSNNPYSSSSGAAYDFYSLNRLKAASEAPGSTGDSDTIGIRGCKEPRDAAWVRRGVSIGKKYCIASLSYPVVVVVEDRGAVRSRLKAEDVDTKTAFEIPRSGSASLIYKATIINGSRFIEKVSHNTATNLPTIIFVAMGKQTRRHH